MRKKRFTAFLLSLAMAGTSLYTCGVIDVQAAAVAEEGTENPNLEQLTELQEQAVAVAEEGPQEAAAEEVVEPEAQAAAVEEVAEPEVQAGALELGGVKDGKVAWGTDITLPQGQDLYRYKEETSNEWKDMISSFTADDVGKTITVAKWNVTSNQPDENAQTTFVVVGKNVESSMVTVSGDFVYTGQPITPDKVVVSDNNGHEYVEEDGDFDTQVENNTQPGTAKVIVTMKEKPDPTKNIYIGSCEKTFTITKRTLSNVKVTVVPAEYPYEGKAIEPDKKAGSTVKVVDASAETVEVPEADYTISWGNSTDVGSANAYVSVNATSTRFTTGSTPQPFTVNNVFKIVSANTGNFDVRFDGLEAGKVKNFAVGTSANGVKDALVVSYNNNAVSTDDYTVEIWKGNAKVTKAVTEALDRGDDYTVRLKGTGNFKDTVKGEAQFKIAGITISEDLLSVNIVNPDAISYNGQQQRPRVTVSLNSGNATYQGVSVNVSSNNDLKEGADKDYTLTYGTNVNAGMGTVTVELHNDYSVTKKVSFNIGKADISANTSRTKRTTKLTYNGDIQTPEFVISTNFTNGDKGTALSSGDYKVILTDGNGIISGNHKCKISGNGNFTGLTQEYDYQIDQKSISDNDVTCDILSKYPYTGEQISPNFTLEYTRLINPATHRISDNRALAKGTDYTVSCGANFDRNSQGTVTITGKGNYKGTLVKTFTIGDRELTKATISGDTNSISYNGKTLSVSDLDVRVYTGNTIVNPGHYTVSLGDRLPKDVGPYTLWIIGKNDYENQRVSCNYEVTPRKFISANVSVGQMVRYTYKDGIDDPNGVVSDNGTGEVLSLNRDYTIERINTSTSSCSVVGKGNYSDDSIQRVYTTQKGEFGKQAKLSVSPNRPYVYAYKGLDMKDSDLTVRDITHDKDLVLYEDYSVAPLSTVMKAGDVDVTIRAHSRSAYKGSQTVSVNIEPKDIGDEENVTFISTNRWTLSENYTGQTREVPQDGMSKNCLSYNEEILNSTNKDYTVMLRKEGSEILSTNYKDAGEYKIIAKGEGNYKGERELGTLTVKKAKLTKADVSLNEVKFDYVEGSVPEIYVIPREGLQQGRDFTVKYAENPGEQGFHTVTVTGIGNYEGEFTLEYVVGEIPLSDNNTEIYYAGVISDNAGEKPVVQVTVNGKAIREGQDYEVVSVSEIPGSSPRKWTVTISGLNAYVGTATKEVEAGKIRILDLNVEVAQNEFTYDGQAHAPAAADVKVTINDKVLSENTDYTLEFPTDTVDAGDYAVKVIGMGDYDGEANGAYWINPIAFTEANVTVGESVVYTGSNVTPEVTVTVGDKTLIAGTDYVIETSGGVQNVGEGKLKVVGIGNYAASTPVEKTFQITPASITGAEVTVAAKTYTGAAQTADVTEVIVGDRVLTAGVDYTVETKRATNAGTTKVQITGKGNYTGTTTGNFVIRQRSIASAKVSGVQDRVYTSRPVGQTTSVKVVLDGKTLKRNTDYTFQFKNNTKIGVASFTLKGRGNYTGVTATQTFKILPKKGTINALKAGSKKFAVTAKRQGGGIQYQVQYRLKTSSRVTRVVSKKAKVVVRGLQKGKTYIVRVRAYKNVGGKNYYGEFSNARSIKIK